MQFRFDFICFLYFHGWVVGWSEDWWVMLNSTQDQIELKLKFELSLAINWPLAVFANYTPLCKLAKLQLRNELSGMGDFGFMFVCLWVGCPPKKNKSCINNFSNYLIPFSRCRWSTKKKIGTNPSILRVPQASWNIDPKYKGNGQKIGQNDKNGHNYCYGLLWFGIEFLSF